jgi:CspA family cold shock protein
MFLFRGGDAMATGNVRKIVHDRGFGFIRGENGKDFFFHSSSMPMGEFDTLHGEEAVEFEIVQGPKGPRAENVRLIG